MESHLTLDIDAQYGILAFFDILGYQNLIKNNKIEVAASVVLNIIENLPQMARNSLTSILYPNGKRVSEDIFNEIKWNIFSDTIWGSLQLKNTDSEVLLLRKWILFLASCLLLQRRAFDDGFPLRGALATGIYVLRNNIFVGMPIVDAYLLCQKQEWSGVALTEKTGVELNQILERNHDKRTLEGINEFLYIYPVPMKSEESKPLICLRWCGARNLISFTYKRPNNLKALRKLVEQKFGEHNKTVGNEVARKVENTALFLQSIYYIFYAKES